MKRILLLICTVLMASSQIQASHLMGGQITAEHIGTDSCLVTLTIYRDTLGINVDTSTQFKIYSVGSNCAGTPLARFDFDFQGFTSLGNGVEEYVFTKLIYQDTAGAFYFPDSAMADYEIVWTTCCRNAAISNLSNPSANSMLLQTSYHTPGSTAVNSTPVFLNPPITAAAINQAWQYNPLPYDADGDSLYFYLDTPWTSCNVVCAGYTLPAAVSSNPFVIDHQTGQITWTPSTLGNWNATVMVDEYRNGQKIGFIRRDMQILVLDSTAFNTGTPANLTVGGTPVQSQQVLQFTVPAYYNFSLHTDVSDVNNDNLTIQMNGEPFILSNNPATQSITNGQGIASATFQWEPDYNQVRDDLYYFAIRILEKNSSSIFSSVQDITVSLEVVYPTDIKDVEGENAVTTGPNPADAYSTLSFTSDSKDNYSLQVLDITGRLMKELSIDAMPGQNSVILSTSELSNGMYLIQLRSGDQVYSSKLLVQH